MPYKIAKCARLGGGQRLCNALEIATPSERQRLCNAFQNCNELHEVSGIIDGGAKGCAMPYKLQPRDKGCAMP